MKVSKEPYVAICPACGAVVCVADPDAVRRNGDDWLQMLLVGMSIERMPSGPARRAARPHDANCKLNAVEFIP